ncbi:MAG: helix-turn-helix domain-containing protein [bacterium]|nr:helix-turn-helix domain-containing protein [bacterium]
MKAAARVSGNICLVIIAMLTVYVPIWGLDPAIDPEDYLIDKWTVEDGLPADKIYAIAQTPDNYLWIGTNSGLVRFDGVKMQIVDSGDKAMTGHSKNRKLYVDSQGALWISTVKGLTRYKDGRFRYFDQTDGIPQKYIKCFFEDVNGRLLVSFISDYIYYYERETATFKKITASKNLAGKQGAQMTQDSKGILWISSFYEGLFKYVNETFTKIELNIPGGVDFIGSVLEIHNGALLVCTAKGLAVLTGKNTELLTTTNSKLSQNRPVQILEDNAHNVWIATHAGLNRLKENNAGKKEIQVILENEDIKCLFEDRENNLWVGTNSSGLMRLKNPVIKTYTTEDGLPNNLILSLLNDSRGNIWIGTNTRISRYRNGEFETVSTDSDNRRFALAEDKNGNIWVGTQKGLLKNPGKNERLFTRKDGLLTSSVLRLFCDSKNRLWIGHFRGICRYGNGEFRTLATPGYQPTEITGGFFEDKNQNITITTSSGIIHLPKGEFPETSAQRDLLDKDISFVLRDSQNSDVLWVGSYQDGLRRFAGGKWFSFSNAPGLEVTYLSQAVEDEDGFLWISSDKGILRLNKKELENFAEGKGTWINTTTFTTTDGMLKNICSKSPLNSIIKTDSGELWFCTTRGICVIEPGKIRMNKQPPAIIMEAVTINDQNAPDIKNLNRKKGVKEVAFQFTAPTFITPGSTRFRYRLEGFEKEWQTLPPEAPRKIRYTDLPTGKYRFRVIAGNRFGVWNTTGVSTDFEILPPYYATFWFWGIILLAAAAAIGGGRLWFKKTYIRKPTPASSYESTQLDPIESKKVLSKLTVLMDGEKLYRDDNLSLKDLAKKLHVSVHFLSQLINEQIGSSFYEMVNNYRIEEVKLRLSDPAQADTPIIDIAYDAGFSTKSSFNRYFKKLVAITPSQFRKNQEQTK